MPLSLLIIWNCIRIPASLTNSVVSLLTIRRRFLFVFSTDWLLREVCCAGINMHLIKFLSFFFSTKNINVFGYRLEKHETNWFLNELVS